MFFLNMYLFQRNTNSHIFPEYVFIKMTAQTSPQHIIVLPSQPAIPSLPFYRVDEGTRARAFLLGGLAGQGGQTGMFFSRLQPVMTEREIMQVWWDCNGPRVCGILRSGQGDGYGVGGDSIGGFGAAVARWYSGA